MGKLFVVATPIGNLKDITFRAVEVLKEVDLIACEDTRKTKILLERYKIKTPLISYHQYSRVRRINYLINQLKSDHDVALVTEAGTPGIADPGQKLIEETVKSKIKVVCLPGPSAVTAALSVSGFKTDEFLFLGFLPKKKGRKKLIQDLKKEKRTLVIYESPYRILKTLQELKLNLGDREAMVARELTKKFEEVYRGKLSKIINKIKTKGEFVIVIKGMS